MKPLIVLFLCSIPCLAQVTEPTPDTADRYFKRCNLSADVEVGIEKENRIYRTLEGGKKYITAVYENDKGELYRDFSKVCKDGCRPTALSINESCGYYYTSCRKLIQTSYRKKNRVRTYVDKECSAAYWSVETGKRIQ